MVSYSSRVLFTHNALKVLILVVVDNGLVPMNICKESKKMTLVLILVVVDNGLVQSGKQLVIGHNAS